MMQLQVGVEAPQALQTPVQVVLSDHHHVVRQVRPDEFRPQRIQWFFVVEAVYHYETGG